MLEAVLGHPYSGALYGYFSDQINGVWTHTRVANSHSYYRTLYGKNYEAYVELALTFLILYDKVWLTPADNPMPKSKREIGCQGFIPELGLHADWDDFRPYYGKGNSQYIQKYLADTQLQQLLQTALKIPKHCWSMIVESAVYESSLSMRKRCPLICSPGRRALINRLIEIDKPSLHPIMPALHEVQFIESYQSLFGMALHPKSLDELMDAKPDPIVRTYGARFLEVALSESGSSTPATEEKVARLIQEAIETERLSKLFSGALNWSGTFCRFSHFLPGALVSRAGALTTDYIGSQAGWYEFSGSIDSAIDKAQMLRRVNKVIAGSLGN
jgi:hypothetical protein